MEPGPTDFGENSTTPLLADPPLPPGSDLAEVVDAIDEAVRSQGPEEIQQADDAADAAGADSDEDPTDDGAAADAPPA